MSTDSPTTFDSEHYLKQKKREKLKTWIFSVLGSIILLDSYSPFPIPLVGTPAVLTGMALLSYGFYQYKSYQRLPILESVQFARSLNRPFSRTDLFLTFQLSPERTDQLIQELVQQGFVEPSDTELPPESEIHYRVIT